jgi:NTP pyrophosphatase (non-canonical NTP hydrolase)
VFVSKYDRFVQDSDQSRNRDAQIRLDIAIYGLAGEVGSLLAAVKKRLLAEGGKEHWNVANDEIVEELGDVTWYCFSLARLANPKKPINIFSHDIANLKRVIGGSSKVAERIRDVLDPAKLEEFMRAAKEFPRKTRTMKFEDYQNLAFLTARTPNRTLVEVCLAVLTQLSAELFRHKLPPVELELNKSVVDRPINQTLGEIAWHIAALASIYGLRFSDIAAKNMEKVAYRLDRRHPTPLHDNDCRLSEQLPRRFKVSFVTVAKGRSRQYLNGRRLGDDLTDNARDDDGYRFHDVMHLANAAMLGWSPVLRGLMGRKRKSDPKIDEVEDGARAKIVEEAVIKAIHSEGSKLAANAGLDVGSAPVRLFPDPSAITFRFLKFIHNFVDGLEVEKNRYWEWEQAIVAGHEVFYQLRCEGQGTITVDLDARSIEFDPDVTVSIDGRVAGLGSALVETTAIATDARFAGHPPMGASDAARKLAVLSALGISSPTDEHVASVRIKDVEGGISVKATGTVQQAMWDRRVIAFRTTIMPAGPNAYICTAIALVDD